MRSPPSSPGQLTWYPGNVLVNEDQGRAVGALVARRPLIGGVEDRRREQARSDMTQVDAVLAALREAGVAGAVREFAASTRTAADAATALGCDVGAIANSLIFIGDDEPLLVLTSGAHRVDLDHLAELLGFKELRRATPEEVRRATGQVIGGVAPVGHRVRLRTVVDRALDDYTVVWAAAGSAHAVFPTSFAELLRVTGGEAVTVAPEN